MQTPSTTYPTTFSRDGQTLRVRLDSGPLLENSPEDILVQCTYMKNIANAFPAVSNVSIFTTDDGTIRKDLFRPMTAWQQQVLQLKQMFVGVSIRKDETNTATLSEINPGRSIVTVVPHG